MRKNIHLISQAYKELSKKYTHFSFKTPGAQDDKQFCTGYTVTRALVHRGS